MSLLDDLSQSSIGDLLGSYGPSLLTQPQMPSQPNDVAPSTGQPLGPPSPLAGMEPTLAQQLAQRAPTHPGGLAGFFGKALDALVPIPEAYKQMMSPADIKRLQMQGLQQIGAGLTGAYTGAGQRKDFGVDLGMGLNASRESTGTALQPLQEMLQTQGMGVGLEGKMMQQRAFQMLGQMQPPADGDHAAGYQYHTQRGTILNQAGDSQAAQAEFRAANNERLMMNGGRTSALNENVPETEWQKVEGKYPITDEMSPTDKQAALYNRAQMLGRDGYPKTAQQNRLQGQALIGKTPSVFQQGATTSRIGLAQEGQGMQQTQNFEKRADVAPALSIAPKFTQMYAVLDQAEKANASSYKTVALNLAQTLDQKGQLRVSMYDIMAQLDPSLRGRFDAAIAKLKDGSYPKEQLANVRVMLDQVREAYRKSLVDAQTDYQHQYPNAKLPKTPSGLLPPSNTPTTQLNPNVTYHP